MFMNRVLILQMTVYALQTLGLVWVCSGRLGLAGFLHLPVFLLTRTGPVIGSTGSRVDPPGRLGLAGFLHLPVFLLTRIGPVTGSTGSRDDPPGRLGLAGILRLPVFLLTRTGPVTGSTGSRVDPPVRFGFNNYGSERSDFRQRPKKMDACHKCFMYKPSKPTKYFNWRRLPC